MNYTYDVRLGEPPRPICVGCAGPVTSPFVVVTKQPREKVSVVCSRCLVRVLDTPHLMLAIELATTLEMTLPEVSNWFIRHGVFEIPITSQGIDEALGRPVGFTRAVWSDR